MTAGQPNRKCGRTNRAGLPCGRPLGWGTDHPGHGPCKLHGGKSPGANLAAARAALEADARALGAPVDMPPGEGIMFLLAKNLGEIMWLTEQVRAETEVVDPDGTVTVDPGRLFGGVTKTRRVDGPDGVVVTTEVSPALSMAYQAMRNAEERYGRLVSVALAHGIAQARIELAEREAETMGQLVAAAVDAAGLTGAVREAAFSAARDRFVVLQGGQTGV